MYYSAVVNNQYDADQLYDTAEAYEIELKIYDPLSFQGQRMLDIAHEQGCKHMPVVMAGDTLLASGKEAWVDLYEHSLANPHVHWEASDGEDGY